MRGVVVRRLGLTTAVFTALVGAPAARGQPAERAGEAARPASPAPSTEARSPDTQPAGPGGADSKPAREKREESRPPAPPPGIAVIELFTSEGCNSCPPADVLAATLAREASEKGTRVVVLAMHVDYWDYLGWKDPFGQSAFTKRQRAYAKAMPGVEGRAGVYTPQMVVNGAVGFVGSDEHRARQEVARAMAESPRLKMEASVVERKPGEPVLVRIGLKGDSRWTTASVAIVEDGLSSAVTRGENAGKTLAHERVVRTFAQQPVKKESAEVEVRLPAGAREERCRVVALVQDEKSMRVLGVVELPLTPAPVPPEGTSK